MNSVRGKCIVGMLFLTGWMVMPMSYAQSFSCSNPLLTQSAYKAHDYSAGMQSWYKEMDALRFADISLLRPEAEKGDSYSQYILGRLLLGIRTDVAANASEAKKWLSLSAKQNVRKAGVFYTIASSYVNDKPNWKSAIASLKEATKKQDALAATELGNIYFFEMKDSENAKHWYEKGVLWGDGAAIVQLKDLHFSLEKKLADGVRAIDPDPNTVMARLYATWEKGAEDLEYQYPYLSRLEQEAFDCIYLTFLYDNKLPEQVLREMRLYNAVRLGDVEQVKQQFLPADKNFMRQSLPFVNENLAETSVRYGQTKVLQFLVGQGMSLPIKFAHTNSLAWSASLGYTEMVEMIAEHFDQDQLDGAMFAALSTQQTDMVIQLLAHGANPDAMIPSSRKTILHAATMLNAENLVKRLVDFGADVNVVENTKGTPLMIAVKRNYLDVAKILVSANADLDYQDKHGLRAIDYALQKGNEEMVKLLKTNR